MGDSYGKTQTILIIIGEGYNVNYYQNLIKR